MAVDLKPLPPEEAIKAFEARSLLKPGFAWQDVWKDEHARAFTVAKMMRLDLLQTVYDAVDQAIKDGTTVRDFQQQLRPILEREGWWGKQEMSDPLTGEKKLVQLGSPRRLQIIFDTNLRTSHAAGQWAQIQRNVTTRPYLRYSAVLDSRTRPQHRSWHGTTLALQDSWWDTHYPPNGWRCRCSVISMSERDLKRYGGEVTPRPATRYREWTNPRTGEIMRVPQGIDPGWDYHPGKAAWRGITPPPLGASPVASVVRNPPALDALPPVRHLPTSKILPEGLSEDEHLRAFLAEFGATPDTPVVYRDVIGNALPINADLFRARDGRSKVGKFGRQAYLLLLAETIKAPDEIWAVALDIGGKTVIRQRYVARYQVADAKIPTLVVFEFGKDGWTGVTAFPPERGEYLERQRQGVRIYRRPE